MICQRLPYYQQPDKSLLDRLADIYSDHLPGNLWQPCGTNITAGESVRFTLGGVQ